MAHVSDVKKQELETLKELIARNSKIGIIDITGLPSLQLQRLKAALKNELVLRITKKSIVKLALEQSQEHKEGLDKLLVYLDKVMPGMLFTKEDVFKLSKLIIKNKSSAPARAGQAAPHDIIIPAGPTPFTPGPVIGELGQLGIKTGVEAGKIIVKEDKVLVSKGELITAKAADIMSKMGIEPMEIGLNLVVMYDNGTIYSGDVLHVDESAYVLKLHEAALSALNLALFSFYITTDTAQMLLGKAYREATSLAGAAHIEFNSDITSPEIGGAPQDDIAIEQKHMFSEEEMEQAKKTLQEWTDAKLKKEEIQKE